MPDIDFSIKPDEFHSNTARLLYESKQKKAQCIQEALLTKTAAISEKEEEAPLVSAEMEKQAAAHDKNNSLDSLISQISSSADGYKENSIPVQQEIISGNPPSLMDFDTLYFERFFNLTGDREAKYRAVLNLITSTSTIYIGPAGGGKSAIQDATKELLPEGMVININNYGDVDDNLKPETTNAKAWFSRELQILVRGSKNQKDVIKLLSNNEDYKGMKIEFFVTSAAVENEYFQKFVIPNKELMRRLDIIEVKSYFNKIESIRNRMSKKRMEGALLDAPDEFTKEYFKKWVSYWRGLSLNNVVDPFCAFHDDYFVKSFKSFDPIKRYHKLEDALLKMKLEESTYKVNEKEVRILSIREKYRADCFRKEINKALQGVDDPETIKKYYGWSDEDFVKYNQSLEKSKQEVDWQSCWESGLESLKQAQQKGLLPASAISEYINRHVVNGKVSVIDDYTGKDVLLAEYPKQVDKEKIVITEISHIPAPKCGQNRMHYLPERRNMLALPAPKED